MASSAASDEYLYRIMPFARVTDFLRYRSFHLSNPTAWQDPFEVLLLHRRSRAFFASCWCRRSVSDAMWGVYSADGTGVRVRTSRYRLQRLAEQFKAANHFDVWLQNVGYHRPTEIRKRLLLLKQKLEEGFSLPQAKKALFLKRAAFDYEHEVRLVVHDRRIPDNTSPPTSLLLPVDPYALLDSIMFDSRAPDSFYRACRAQLEGELAFRGPVGKSVLYKLQGQLVAK